jgi:hypothetical protein
LCAKGRSSRWRRKRRSKGHALSDFDDLAKKIKKACTEKILSGETPDNVFMAFDESDDLYISVGVKAW